MKAVSVVVSLVMIIAIVIAVGGMLSFFFSDFVKSQSEPVQETGDKMMKCENSLIDIEEVRTDSDLNPVNITVSYIQSATHENLYNFTIYILTTSQNLYQTSNLNPTYIKSNPFTLGQKVTWSINTTGLSGSLEEVRVTALCQDSYPVSDDCRPNYVCMK